MKTKLVLGSTLVILCHTSSIKLHEASNTFVKLSLVLFRERGRCFNDIMEVLVLQLGKCDFVIFLDNFTETRVIDVDVRSKVGKCNVGGSDTAFEKESGVIGIVIPRCPNSTVIKCSCVPAITDVAESSSAWTHGSREWHGIIFKIAWIIHWGSAPTSPFNSGARY